MVRTSLFALMCFVLIGLVGAKPEFYDQFVATYAPKAKLTAAKCGICHTIAPQRNPFGKQVGDALSGDNVVAALRAVERMDADGDGDLNLTEIRSDSEPGVAATPAPPITTGNAMFPKHSFHPIIVHFPIALFQFGVFLEFLGWKRGDPNVRYAALLCLLGGGLSAYGAVITGLLFFFRGGFEWSGPPLNHFIAGVAATLLMTTVVLWRLKGAHESKVYFALIALAAALVGLTGHLGGMMVFG